jgi:hypothetical protein
MLSGEFRTDDHSRYLSDQPDSTKWDANFEVRIASTRPPMSQADDTEFPTPLGRSSILHTLLRLATPVNT